MFRRGGSVEPASDVQAAAPKRRLRDQWACVGLAAAFALAAISNPTRAWTTPASSKDSIYDYMVMDVCVDASNRMIRGLTPADSQCTRRRNIEPGEPVAYELHNFRPRARGCAQSLGTIAKVNIPVVKAGVTRIVSSYNHDLGAECAEDATTRASAGGGDLSGGASVQGYDGGFGYIMGSWSPVALSSFVGPLCSTSPSTAIRFARGWVIGPSTPPAQSRAYGYISLPSALETGPPSLSTPCPTLSHAGFTTWVRDTFTFTSGLALDSIMSEHFSRASDMGDAPGEAEQVERTYWTRAFGLSRWEKWARDDWVNPRNHMTALQQAQAEYRSGNCKTPYSIAATVSPHLAYAPIEAPNVFARTVRQPGQTAVHIWYMTLCEDYTNIVKLPAAAKPVWEGGLRDEYWVN